MAFGYLVMLALVTETMCGVQNQSKFRTVTSSAILFETPIIPAITEVIKQPITHTTNKSTDETSFYIQIQDCHQNPSKNASSSTIHSKLYTSLLPKSATNTTKTLTIKLQPKPPILPLPPVNDSFSIPLTPETNIRRRGNRGSLDMKLNDEWTRNDHMSHIYIGSSLFPLLTEESRIIDKKQTTIPTTKKSVAQQKTPRRGGYRFGSPPNEQQPVRGRLLRSSGLEKIPLGVVDEDVKVSSGTSEDSYYKQITSLCESIMKRFRRYMGELDKPALPSSADGGHKVIKRSRNSTRRKLEEKKIANTLGWYEFIPEWLRFWKR